MKRQFDTCADFNENQLELNKMLILTSSGVISAKVKKSQARNRVYLNGEPTPKIMILPWTDHVKIRTLTARNKIDFNG